MEEKIENILEEPIVDEIVEVEVEKPKRVKPAFKTKDCEVLHYNKRNKTMIVSFDGLGFELKDIEENPGNKVTVKYFGKVGTPSFKLELK